MAPKIKTVQRNENDQIVFYLEHHLYLPDIPEAPADGPYGNVKEAEEAAGRLLDAWQASGGDDERSLSDPPSQMRPSKSAGEV